MPRVSLDAGAYAGITGVTQMVMKPGARILSGEIKLNGTLFQLLCSHKNTLKKISFSSTFSPDIIGLGLALSVQIKTYQGFWHHCQLMHILIQTTSQTRVCQDARPIGDARI